MGATFGQGTGPALLNDVGCAGNESSLLSCDRGGFFRYCSSAKVVCPSCKLGNFIISCECMVLSTMDTLDITVTISYFPSV